MKNKIVASVEFYFKGERYSPKTTIDLDRLMKSQNNSQDTLALIHPMLAKENGIDLYSYEFEIMLGEPIQFSEATGIATDHLRDGQFFIADFEKDWQEEKILEYIQPIAKQHLAIDDLTEHPDLKKALTASFIEGQNKSSASD
jgi:hypothetical protein